MTAKMFFDAFIFDLDGTIYLGDSLLPGALETIAFLRGQNKKILFISNKPLEPRQAYAKKLTRLGIATCPEDILTSAFILGHYLINHHPNFRYYVVGEEGLKKELSDYGLTISDELEVQDSFQVINPTGIDAVIVAFDRTLNYRKLNTAYQALFHGAAFFATNSDKTCPLPGGGIPDAGAIVAYLEFLTGRTLDLLAGKPSPLMIQVAAGILNLPPDRCLLIGDRMETDMRMGQAAGIHTALVLTGVSQREDLLFADPHPEFIFESLWDLHRLIVAVRNNRQGP
jgi:arabinose operon protein AraL